MFDNHINAQILFRFLDRVVREELYVTSTLTKACALDCTTVWPLEPLRKMAWQDFTIVCTLIE